MLESSKVYGGIEQSCKVQTSGQLDTGKTLHDPGLAPGCGSWTWILDGNSHITLESCSGCWMWLLDMDIGYRIK